MGPSTTMAPVDSTAALGRFATMLACAGAPGLPAALTVLVDGLGLRSAVLRSAPDVDGGQLIAVAGDVVHAVALVPAQATGHPGQHGPTVQLPVPGPGGRELAALTVVDARPRLLPALRVAAAVLGLVLSAQLPAELAEVLLAAAEQDRDELADDLHDGPVQDLVVARYAVEAALRAEQGPAVVAAVQLALVGLRRALWHLRPRGSDGLAAALASLSRHLVEAGRRPLLVQLLPGGDALRGTRAVTGYRLVQAAVLPAPLPGPVSVTLRAERDCVLMSVDGGLPLREPLRWERRARALGGHLVTAPGRLQLSLPAVPCSPSRRSLPTPKAAL